jgi:hypothetical protein
MRLDKILSEIKTLNGIDDMKPMAALACGALVFDDGTAAALFVKKAYDAIKLAHEGPQKDFSAEERKILGTLAVLFHETVHKHFQDDPQ